jgi:hypothetical protein
MLLEFEDPTESHKSTRCYITAQSKVVGRKTARHRSDLAHRKGHLFPVLIAAKDQHPAKKLIGIADAQPRLA